MSDRTVQLLIGLGIALAGLLGGGAGTQLWQGPVKPEPVCEAMRAGLTEAIARQHEELRACKSRGE